MFHSKNALNTGNSCLLKSSFFKCIFAAVVFLSSVKSFAQVLTQHNFAGILVPQYMSATTSNRLPVMFRAKVSGLEANRLYRYYIQGATNDSTNGAYMDLGNLTSGAGATILVNMPDTTYILESSPGLSSVGKYGTFTTDATGSFTGWFGLINLGNSRYTAGNEIFPTITLNNGNGGTTPALRFALDVKIKVLGLSATSSINNGTGIWGTSAGTAKNIVALYDNTSGTGRPLSMAYIESENASNTSAPSFYGTNVNAKAGRWGTLIPNINANGVRKIEQFSIATGSQIGCNTDDDGIWTTGNIKTTNPIGGTSALQINIADAPLTNTCGNSTSFMSDIATSPNFNYPVNIDYTSFQESNNITLNNSSLAVASFDLRDGGGTNDADNLPTTLNSITFSITNAAFIRRAALYSGETELAETIVNGPEITFNNLVISAADNASANFTLRVSFTENVIDNDQIIFTITNTEFNNSGSGFFAANAGGSSSATFGDINRIEVTATKLNFSAEPNATATVFTPLAVSPEVIATDPFNKIDKDFSGEVILTNDANLSTENSSVNMVAGTAKFPVLYFTEAGKTKFNAHANALFSAISTTEILVGDAKKWDGGAGTENWTDAANWSDNIIPSNTEVVVLDNSHIENSYNVLLPDFSTSVSYLRISASNSNTIKLTLPATNVACPGLTVGDDFSISTDMEIDNGGVFINATGCADNQGFILKSLGSKNSLKINNGGKYIHRNSKPHTDILDAAVLHENSTFVFDAATSTALAISITNRTFGNLVLSGESKVAKQSYSANYANPAIVKGNLIIESNAGLSLSGTGNIEVGGDFITEGTFSTGTSARKLIMNGHKAQSFSGSGTFTIKNLEINNPEGVALLSPIKLSNSVGANLTLENGNLFTSSTNILTIEKYTKVIGGSKNSFISGPVAKMFGTTSESTIFLPVGKDTFYRPVSISPETIETTSTFKVEYFATASSNDLAKHANTLGSVNNKEHWEIERIAGSTAASVALSWGESSDVQYVEELRIVRWDGNEWTEVSKNTASGSASFGTISSDTLTTFGMFTLGESKVVPLPVNWLYFTAKKDGRNVQLNWATSCEINNDGFEIQRSTDGLNFEAIGWKNGNGNSSQKHFYSYADMGAAQLNSNIIYYRLKQIDYNGTSEFSTVESIRKKSDQLSDVSIYADAQKCLNIRLIAKVNASTKIEIINLSGQVIQSTNTYVNAGNAQYKLPLYNALPGLYFVRIQMSGDIFTQKIVLQ